MTLALSGQAIESGIAIGAAHILRGNEIEIGEYAIEAADVPAETDRLHQAAASTAEHLAGLADRVDASAGGSAGEIIRTHVAMLRGSSLLKRAQRQIEDRLCNAEWALQLELEALLEGFRAVEDDYIRGRADDALQVVRMVQQALAEDLRGGELRGVPDRLGQTLVVATELTPGDLASLHARGVAGVVTEHGSPYSHTAILARSLGVPTVMGVRRAQALVTEGEQLVLDGHYGIVFADPVEAILQHYLAKQSESERYRRTLATLRDRPARSIDGRDITLLANAERPEDIERALLDGAAGVGLYRSEMLFLEGTAPDEDQQLHHYRAAQAALSGAPLTIRTLDLGTDKSADLLDFESLRNHANPALGLRAVRLCLREVELFKTQLRAIARASAEGPVRCMIPMLTSEREIVAVRALLRETQAELTRDGLPFDPEMPLGGMIEIPAAALSMEILARHLDFVSVGTNDLIQYLLAADRVDEHVAHLYEPEHPGVIHLLAHIFDTAQRLRLAFSVCGEMAGDRRYTRLLLALGLTEFSMQPRSLLEVKKVIAETDVARARKALESWRADQTGQARQSLVQALDRAQLPTQS